MDKHSQQVTKLTIEFSAEEAVYLKTICAHQGITMDEFVIQAVLKSVEDYEDELDFRHIEETKHDIETHGTISWTDLKKELGL